MEVIWVAGIKWTVFRVGRGKGEEITQKGALSVSAKIWTWSVEEPMALHESGRGFRRPRRLWKVRPGGENDEGVKLRLLSRFVFFSSRTNRILSDRLFEAG